MPDDRIVPDDRIGPDDRIVQDTPMASSSSALNELKEIRVKNLNRLIFGHLNINSLRNKIELLTDQIRGNIDVLLISETKLDNSFPTSQFTIEGYNSPFRLDRNKDGGGLMLYVRDDIPAKQLKHPSLDKNFENMFVELNLRNKKWLVSCTYNPHVRHIQNHLQYVSKNLDSFSSNYDNFVLLGDFNAESHVHFMQKKFDTYNLKPLIKKPTCFKNPEKPTCIDHILTNRPKSFCNSTI